jgi:hypothetical protein
MGIALKEKLNMVLATLKTWFLEKIIAPGDTIPCPPINALQPDPVK